MTTEDEVRALFACHLPHGHALHAVWRVPPCGEGKGRTVLFAKFNTALDAALAMEAFQDRQAAQDEALRGFSVAFATPKGLPSFRDLAASRQQRKPVQAREERGDGSRDGSRDEAPEATRRLFVVHSRDTDYATLEAAFAAFPGFEGVDMKVDHATGQPRGFSFAMYETAAQAAEARGQLDRQSLVEDVTSRLTIKFADAKGLARSRSRPDASAADGGAAVPEQQRPVYPAMDSGELQAYATPFPDPQPFPDATNGGAGARPRRARATGKGAGGGEGKDTSRLFVRLRPGCEGGLHKYRDVFGNFGTVEYVSMVPNRNFGFVKFQSAAAAASARSHLDGQRILGQTLGIRIADAPRGKDE